MTRAISTLCVALACLGGCSDRGRAPAVRAQETDAGSRSTSTVPTFEEESETSFCGQTTVGLEVIRNNLYFVLDASGSMTARIPGTDDLTRYEAASNAIESVLQSVGHRVNYGTTIFPGEGEDGCVAGREVFILQRGDLRSHAVTGFNGPVLQTLVRRLAGVDPGGGTSTSATLRKVRPALERRQGQSFVFLITDGAPNCNPDASCGVAGCIANIEGWQYSDSQICDETVNCCQDSPRSCLDADATLSEIEQLAEANIKTFVIGIPGTLVYADFLGALATAGGTARDAEPYYYSVTSSDELSSVLQELGQGVSISCVIELNEAPPDPNLVNVLFDDEPIPFDEEDGWRWVDGSSIELVGSRCEVVENGHVNQIDVVAGCPVLLR